MIFTKIITLIFDLLTSFFDLLPSLPDIPVSIINSLNSFLDLIFSNLNLLGFFVRLDTVKILFPLVILVLNFEHIYSGIMWIYRKIKR